MNPFLKRFRETAAVFPDREAVVDRDGTRSTTYRQLYEQAARVNRWLRDHDIGTESVVAIYFPKGVEYIAVRIGIIMAGAAWVGLEDMMGLRRIEFVTRDCGCAAVFDEKLWEEAMLLPPSYDFADPDDHDLAFLIYTSGSTGEPKGAANEYGIYEYIMAGMNSLLSPYVFPEGRNGRPSPVRFAHVLPETFVGGVYITVGFLDAQSTIHVISSEMTRDPKRLIRYFAEHGIDTTFMTPTFLNLAMKIPGLSLRAAFTGGEIVSDLFSDRFDIVNMYGPSEFGYPACLFTLDRPYDVTPIGYPVADTDFRLIDENGRESDEGVLAVRLPWFRGYHHMPEENEYAAVFLHGEKYFRTSDIARRDEKGCYTILGRADDMIKINGNRIDPAETEKAMKAAFGLEFCAVRPVRVGERTALCAWYLEDKVPEPEQASKILREHLPDYMLPSCYVRIDEIPLNANGKVDKKALPEPDLNLQPRPAAAPETMNERLLCDLLQRVLKLGRAVGADEDFFNLGGDSLRAMQIIAEDVLPGLTIPMIYEGRTAKRICRLYSERIETGKDRKPGNAKQMQAPLNTEQQFFLEYDRKYPGTTMFNIPLLFCLKDDADLQMLADAVRKVKRAHPALLSTIEPGSEGGCRQRYVPAFDAPVPVEKVTDEAMAEICRSFVRPFRPDGSPMMRCRILEGDTGKKLLFDVSHLVCDGWSLNLIFADVGRAMNGEAIPEDCCFELLREEADRKASAGWQKDMEYFRNRFDREGFVTLPKPDHVTKDNENAGLFLPFTFSREAAKKVSTRYRLGKNGLYLLASAMAIAEYNGSPDVLISWTWNGRADARTMNSVGVYFRDLPAAFHIEKDADIPLLLKETEAQIEEGVAHGRTSYFMKTGNYRGSDLFCLTYQGDLYQYDPDESVAAADVMDKDASPCNNALNAEILESGDDFGVMLSYNAAMYEKASMARFIGLICDKCAEIIDACRETAK